MRRPGGVWTARHLLFWCVLFGLAAGAGALLFFSGPLFLEEAGVRPHLVGRAARLRGLPPARAAAGVGRILKAYLDASRRQSRTEAAVTEASAARLALTLTLPWAEVSAKKRRQRAELTARLAADMLRAAGAEGTTAVVRLRRRRMEGEGSDPAGSARYEPGSGRVVWRPAP